MKPLLALSLFLSQLSATWDRTCQSGPGVQLRPDSKEGYHCSWQDRDYDGDVDQSDYGLYQRTEDKAIIVFVVDLSLGMSVDPAEYVRRELNRRAAQRN